VARGALGFGIVRSVDATLGRARLAELCTVLTEEIGVLFVPHHPHSYRRLAEEFDTGEVSIAWLPPIVSWQLQDGARASVLALPARRGSLSYCAAIFARPDGPQTLAELAGRRMAWVDPDSSSGYLVPRLCLQGAGLDVGRLFAQESFLMSHSAVVDAVLAGRFDAGATYCQPHGVHGKPRGAWGDAPVHVLTTSGAIPNDAIVVSRAVAADVRSKILRWLLNLQTPRAKSLCSDLFGAEGFRIATPEHFEPLRRILIAARAHGSMPPPPPGGSVPPPAGGPPPGRMPPLR
jgi:phosphonate transport system substrate-binding protein